MAGVKLILIAAVAFVAKIATSAPVPDDDKVVVYSVTNGDACSCPGYCPCYDNECGECDFECDCGECDWDCCWDDCDFDDICKECDCLEDIYFDSSYCGYYPYYCQYGCGDCNTNGNCYTCGNCYTPNCYGSCGSGDCNTDGNCYTCGNCYTPNCYCGCGSGGCNTDGYCYTCDGCYTPDCYGGDTCVYNPYYGEGSCYCNRGGCNEYAVFKKNTVITCEESAEFYRNCGNEVSMYPGPPACYYGCPPCYVEICEIDVVCSNFPCGFGDCVAFDNCEQPPTVPDVPSCFNKEWYDDGLNNCWTSCDCDGENSYDCDCEYPPYCYGHEICYYYSYDFCGDDDLCDNCGGHDGGYAVCGDDDFCDGRGVCGNDNVCGDDDLCDGCGTCGNGNDCGDDDLCDNFGGHDSGCGDCGSGNDCSDANVNGGSCDSCYGGCYVSVDT